MERLDEVAGTSLARGRDEPDPFELLEVVVDALTALAEAPGNPGGGVRLAQGVEDLNPQRVAEHLE